MDDMDAAPLAMDPGDFILGRVTYAPNAPSAPVGARIAVPLDREAFVRGLAMAVVSLAFNGEPDRVDEEAERIAKRIAAFIDKGQGG